MHRISIFIILVFASAIAMAQAKMEFDHKVHKFPKTDEGEWLEHEYTFTNTGTEALIISNIKVACHCTTFEYPKEPVLPGKTGVITVTFDTRSKQGWQNRILQIFSNTADNPSIIRFKVMVVPLDGWK